MQMSSFIGQNLQGTAVEREVSQVLEAFESTTGFKVCLKVLSDQRTSGRGLELSPAPFNEHRSDFCREVKSRALAACTKCDHTDLINDCQSESGRRMLPFIRTCHAGADEVLLPIWSQSVLVAVLFVGQFVVESSASPVAGKLQSLSGSDQQRILTMTYALRSYLREVLGRLAWEQQIPANERRRIIDQYIRERLSAGPSLDELGRRLSLSPSRAGHVVREVSGMSFLNLVETSRLELTKDLLARSGGTVASVARQAGFNDAGYFCRYFKQKTGKTPTQYRRENKITPLI